MSARSNIEKGKILENYVADRIRGLGIDPKAYRAHGSGNGNREKSDIWTNMMVLGQNVGIECKNHKTICLPEWWRQVKKLESLGREPVLVFKQYGEPLEETKVVIYLETFLMLARDAQRGATHSDVPADIRNVAKDLRQLADELDQLSPSS